MLLPIEDKETKREASPSILLMSGKELLNEVKKEKEMQFVVVRKPIFRGSLDLSLQILL